MEHVLNPEHSCFHLDPRPADWLMGAIPFKAVCSDWLSHCDFYEPQKLANGDTDDCWCFSFQESFDAQMDLLLPTFSAEVQQEISAMGFMDLSSADNKLHFHSSPRFIGVLSGVGQDGGTLPLGWDTARKYGVVPFSVLPVLATMTLADYFAPMTPQVMAIGAKFLALIGGKASLPYQYVADGKENLAAMRVALQQSPLLIGINPGSDWNTDCPAPPDPSLPPQHVVMLVSINAQGDMVVFDHYTPNPKTLLAGWPVAYCLQGIVQPTFPPPVPPVQPPNPTIPPAPTLPPSPTVQQEISWLGQLKLWLQEVLASLQK